MKVLNIYKPISITPFQLIEKMRVKFPEVHDKKIAYAGRLDPMAHGVMLYLIGDETKNRDQYQKLAKTYKTKIIFGISTDTYDVLGLTTSINQTASLDAAKKASHKFTEDNLGLRLQKYPPFSYPKINGEPMYKLAREGRLKDKDIPEKEIFIYEIRINNFKKINFSEVKEDIINKIKKVKGDFRQKEIIKKYKSINNLEVITADAYFEVSSGTYIRSLVYELGQQSGLGAIAYDIYRTQVGEYSITDSIKL